MLTKAKNRVITTIKDNFVHATLNFIFIIAFVNIFQSVFGPENSIVGVIFAIMMSASMVRDMTAEPARHLILQALVLVGMAAAAFLVTTLPPLPAFFFNLAVTFLILYTFTYEYSSHMYFPYMLSYLFLVFITPASSEQLPMRLLAMLAGAVCIILYQLIMGRKRVVTTARDMLSDMIDQAQSSISCVLGEEGKLSDPAAVRKKLCELSKIVYERRKKVLCVSDASFNMIDSGRGIENLILMVQEMNTPVSVREKRLLEKVRSQLMVYRAFLHQEISEIPPADDKDFCEKNEEGTLSATEKELYHTLCYIRDRLLHMADPQKRLHYHKTALSVKVRLQAALDISPVRVIYALRVSLLLSFATLFVQLLQLPHGKWLLFTLASVSLPYADDVPAKIKKRIAATFIGGLVSVALYSAMTSSGGRTAVMMLSGYVSYYLTGYTATFSCSTIGALGGAVFTTMFSLKEVAGIFLIRFSYIIVGALIGYLINCQVVPYKRTNATQQLYHKYQKIVNLLSQICHREGTDPQLYYHLLIQAHMIEDKLSQNASDGGFADMQGLLTHYREQVRKAHHNYIPDREDAFLFNENKPAAVSH